MQRLHQEFRDVQDAGEKHALSSLLLHFFSFFYFPNIIRLHVRGGNNSRKTLKKKLNIASFLSLRSFLSYPSSLFISFHKKKDPFFNFFFIPQSPCSKGRDKARAIFSFLHFFCGPPVESPLAFPSVAERRPYFPEGQN